MIGIVFETVNNVLAIVVDETKYPNFLIYYNQFGEFGLVIVLF